ncbi:MAG: GntR family transcriptional regulator [Acidobacteriota bacterium]
MTEEFEVLSDAIYHHLKEDIVTCLLKPGSPITEGQVTKRYNVSRTPVREACFKLEKDGLLQIISNKGYIVSPVSARDINEIYQMRQIFETYAADQIVDSITPQELAELKKLCEDSYAGKELEALKACIAGDFRFHTIIVGTCRNERMTMMYENLLHQLRRIFFMTMSLDRRAEIEKEHHRIFESLESRDRELASQLISTHSQGSKERVLKRLFK